MSEISFADHHREEKTLARGLENTEFCPLLSFAPRSPPPFLPSTKSNNNNDILFSRRFLIDTTDTYNDRADPPLFC